MTQINEYLEMRLREWADWFRSGRDNGGLGFPKESLEYRLWRDGIIVRNKSGSSGALPTNQSAEQIEHWVWQMHAHFPKQSAVLRERYFNPKKIPVEAMARKLKMNRRGFEDTLRLAKHFILSRLMTAL